MMKIKFNLPVAVICLAAGFIAGCNIGNAPSGGSNEEVKAAYDNLPLDEKLKVINSASMPAEAKKQKIAEAYQKAGKTPPEDGGATTPNPSGPPPGVGTPSQGGR